MGNFIPIKCDLTSLVESIPKGVSKIFDLAFGKAIAKKDAVKKLIEAKAERESRLITEGKGDVDKNGLFISFEQNKTDNAQQCFEYAVIEAMNKEYEPSEENISRTFFNQWREYAQYIDEEELKAFWGRVLVEEVYTPNTINLRVLNTLSMLSPEEARIFNNSIRYIIFDKYLAIDFIPLENKNTIIETLYSIGAISSVPNPGIRLGTRILRFKKDSYDYHYFYQQNDNFCIGLNVEESADGDNDGLSLELLELTAIGKTLYKLAMFIDEDLSINLAKDITKDVLTKIDSDKASKIISINVYKLENESITSTLFFKNLNEK